MNWLAHLHLSEMTTDFQLGNVMTDALKGQRWPGMSDDFIRGIECHHAIDAFTDSHPVVDTSKARLKGNPRLRGVAVDVFYDLLLTRNWQHYSAQTMRKFLEDFYQRALPQCRSYPPLAREFVESLVESDRLGRYGKMSDIEGAFERIDSRLSERVLQRGRLVEFMPSLKLHYEHLETDFRNFYPLLQQHVAAKIARRLATISK
ncbi:MAG: ACP phosphodiesterase [Verrucomicrobiales bacterium]|nr:ACP phosphodiesterase [Verrucomicrobiales bacterium]